MSLRDEKGRKRRNLYHIATERSEVISHLSEAKIYRICVANISHPSGREGISHEQSEYIALFAGETLPYGFDGPLHGRSKPFRAPQGALYPALRQITVTFVGRCLGAAEKKRYAQSARYKRQRLRYTPTACDISACGGYEKTKKTAQTRGFPVFDII